MAFFIITNDSNGFHPDYVLEFVMKGQYAKIASVHARFYDEEIVNPILKNKIEEPTQWWRIPLKNITKRSGVMNPNSNIDL